jgi:hypothetical protein
MHQVKGNTCTHIKAVLVVSGAEFRYDRLQVVLLEPCCEGYEVTGTRLCAISVAAREVHVQILMNINRRIVQWVHKLVQPLARGVIILASHLRPRVSARESIPGRKNELPRTRSADRVDCGLIVLQDELCGHIMRLVVDTEEHVRVVQVPAGQLAPKLAKLLRRRRLRVGRVPNYGPGVGLRRGIIVPHVVVRVNEDVCALVGNVRDGGVVLVEVRFVEGRAQPCGERAQTFHEESDAEEVNLLLINEDIDGSVVSEVILHTELSRKDIRTKFSSGLCKNGFNTLVHQ